MNEPVIDQMEIRKEPGEPIVYIGPDIPGIKQYSVYNNGLPDALKEKTKEHPVFLSLIVPVSRLPQANKELSTEGSALTTLFQRANQLIKREM